MGGLERLDRHCKERLAGVVRDEHIAVWQAEARRREVAASPLPETREIQLIMEVCA
jgi:hypothetical protein